MKTRHEQLKVGEPDLPLSTKVFSKSDILVDLDFNPLGLGNIPTLVRDMGWEEIATYLASDPGTRRKAKLYHLAQDQDKTRQDKTRQDTRQDKTRQDKTRQGGTTRDGRTVRHDTRQDKTRLTI
jgi:hypothetical protein